MPAKPDPLPLTVEGCDRELTTAAAALPQLSERSRRLMLARADRLLDRRLMLTCDSLDLDAARERGAAVTSFGPGLAT